MLRWWAGTFVLVFGLAIQYFGNRRPTPCCPLPGPCTCDSFAARLFYPEDW